MTDYECPHGRTINGNDGCIDCEDEGILLFIPCECTGLLCVNSFKGMCLSCEKQLPWSNPNDLPKWRPCPTCYPVKGEDTEFSHRGFCYECETVCLQDLSWYFKSGRNETETDEQYLQRFEEELKALEKPKEDPPPEAFGVPEEEPTTEQLEAVGIFGPNGPS